MWTPDSLWLEVAVVMSMFAIGNILLGHFEEHRPKWRRVLKLLITLALVLVLSSTVGRVWAFGLLLLPLGAALVIHLWWLPRNGINGWTGEPKDKYYKLIGHNKNNAG